MNNIFDKFPPERKHEFLNWLMVTRGQDEWSQGIYNYMCYHELKNWHEGMKFVIKWSHCPARQAYWLTKEGLAEPEWAIKIIENADINYQQSEAAYWMWHDGYASIEWYIKILGK